MIANPAQKPYHELPFILSSLLETFVVSVYSVLFLTAYFTFEEGLFDYRLGIWLSWLPWLLLLAGVVLVLRWLFKETISGPGNEPSGRFYQSDMFPFIMLTLFMAVIEVLHLIGITLPVIGFLAFLAAIYSFYQQAGAYVYHPKRLAWNHPTTAGNLFESTVNIGCAMGLWLYDAPSLQHLLGWILLASISLQFLTLWARFRFLSRTSEVTRNAVRMMLGSHLSLFGIRFIFGMVMPFVYLFWGLVFSNLPLSLVGLLVLVGESSDRILFFITAHAGPPATMTKDSDTSPIEDYQRGNSDAAKRT